MTVAGALEQINGNLITVLNNLTISASATHTLLATNTNTDLILGNEQIIFSGDGRIILNDDLNNRIYGTLSNYELINRTTIEGAGQIGFNRMLLDNEGTIEATGNISLIIDLSVGSVLNNEGILRATARRSLRETRQGH